MKAFALKILVENHGNVTITHSLQVLRSWNNVINDLRHSHSI